MVDVDHLYLAKAASADASDCQSRLKGIPPTEFQHPADSRRAIPSQLEIVMDISSCELQLSLYAED